MVQTSVQNIKNSGEHNTIQLSTITNSTILQAAVPHQIYQSHPCDFLSVIHHSISYHNKNNLSHIQTKLKAQPP